MVVQCQQKRTTCNFLRERKSVPWKMKQVTNIKSLVDLSDGDGSDNLSSG